jgi:hypothetical protein
MSTALCVLRSGGDFGPQHVQWLARQVPGLVCLADTGVPGVPTIRLRHSWPLWWPKLEAFDTALVPGDVWLIDLDTVVFEMPQQPAGTTVLRDFYRPHQMASGFMFLQEPDRERCWVEFTRAPERHMRECTRWPKWGDQGFLQPLLGHVAKWGDEIRSFKVHCAVRVPAGTKVVCFHGKPRPWHAGAAWIPPLRAATTEKMA